MTKPSSLIDLKKTLHEGSWPQVIPALRQDPIIWQTLQSTEFRASAISKCGNDPQRWTPAHLSLLSLETEVEPETLWTTPLVDLDPDLRVQAKQAYESFNSDDPPKMTISSAGLLGLALLEHHHLTHSWEKIPQADIWRTAYACLFGFLQQPIKLLGKLPIPIQIHVILANPLTQEERINTLTSTASPLDTLNRLAFLRSLRSHRSDLATEIAQKLWRGNQDLNGFKDANINHSEIFLSEFDKFQTLSESLNTDLAYAEAQLTAGYNLKAASKLHQAWKTSQEIQNNLSTQVTQIFSQLGNIEKSRSDWNTIKNPPEIPSEKTAALALTWLEDGYIKDARALLEDLENSTSPMVQLSFACLHKYQGKIKDAQEAALKALEGVSTLSFEYQIRLTKCLLENRLVSQAIHLLETIRNTRPNCGETIKLIARAHAAAGAYPQAIHAAHLTVAYEPDNIDTYRFYALLHELAGLWPASLEAREHIIEMQDDPQPTDYHYLAKSALELDQVSLAQDTCWLAIEHNPEDGMAHALLGSVFSRMGDEEQALHHYQEGIRFASENSLPWVLLAQFHNQTDNPTNAIETLQKGVNTAADQAEIHLALGEEYLLSGSQSQALTCLRKANKLSEMSTSAEAYHLHSRIALPLANTLFELGHAEEALQTIQGAFPLSENQVSMLHLQAQILTFTNQPEQAIPLLAKALIIEPQNAEINFDYAKAQLAADQDPGKAVTTLLVLLELDPDHSEALAWLAESLKASGDPTNALSTYRKALGTGLNTDPHWHPRLSIGLAQTAIELGQPETALAVLQKDWQTTTHNHLVILQTLAEAYQNANLHEKALQSAHATRELVPNSVENLIWYANLAEEIQAFDATIEVLNQALELEPERSDLRIHLGLIYQKVGDINEAHKTIRFVAEVDQTTNQELREAARLLVEMGHPQDGISCLKIAVRRCLENQEMQPCTKLIFELMEIFTQLGLHSDALESIDEILELQAEEDPVLLAKRAILLNQLDRQEDAYAVLTKAFSQYPDSNPLHLAASQINYANGNLEVALEHAQKAVDSVDDHAEVHTPFTVIAFAADLFDASLQPSKANQVIQLSSTPLDRSDNLPYLCLRAELALQYEEEIDAAQALTVALGLAPKHPRVLALQARLTTRHGDLFNAKHILNNALSAWGDHQHQDRISPSDLLGISEAALELHEWNAANFLLREAVKRYPQEPRAHLRLVRGLVMRAEHQRLCETLRVVQHAPGKSSLAEFSYQLFEEAILGAVQTSENLDHIEQRQDITHWRVRGQAVFQPIQEHAQALGEIPHTTESYGAFLAAVRYSQNSESNPASSLDPYALTPKQLKQDSDSSVILWAEIAMALVAHNPDLARTTAQNALDTSIRQRYPSHPIFYAVQATIAEQTGDIENARVALENALSQWEDEPRWHLWVADIAQSGDDPDQESILHHLSQATQLEPKFGLHHLKLGQAYLQNKDPQSAMPALEEATRFLSQNAEAWLALANACQMTGEISQIFPNAERAAQLDPTNVESYTLLAESALEINNPEKAIQYCEDGLEIDPQNAKILMIQARALDQVEKYPEALKAFDQALEYTPKSVPLMLEYARFTRRAEGIDAQVDALQGLADEYPDNALVLARLAEALVENNQVDPAILTAQKALQCSQGTLGELEEAQLQLLLGRLLRRSGQLDQAIHCLSQAIHQNAESFESYLELGRVYQDRRQYTTALDAFQQAIALDPGNSQAYYLAGQTLKSAKDYAAAEEMLQNAARLAPEDLAIRRQLGGLVALNLVHNRKETTELYVE